MIAACAEDVINEQGLQPIVDDAPEILTVGFEENDTRVQLNEETKTVWTKGDLVSVFYRSDANQKWQYQGETGERIGNLKCVDAGTATRDMDRVVVVYPYSGDYYINPSTFNVQATLPATQTYLKDSYGVGCNLMVSQSEFTQFSLKSVCGWLKLQLTGNGKVVKSIKFCGNNGEQVAGLIYVDTYTAESTLALEVGNNGGGNLIFDDTILTEVTLDCGEGVTLGAEATAFYIALPPQTFTEGFTVEVNCEGYSPMTISTSNKVVIERNHIQPMAAKEHDAEVQIPDNEIWYTSTDGEVVMPYVTDAFDANIVSNTYRNGKGVIKYDGDVTTIGDRAFAICSSLTSITIPDGITSIGIYAFYGCSSLTSLTIPDSITSIGGYAFQDCTSLTSITIPDGITSIGNNAFDGCSSLTGITIPDSITSIGIYAFRGCSSLTSVTIPDGITSIGNYTFAGCSSLTSITIPDGVTSIGYNAFLRCSSLTSITIPDGVTKIGRNAFDGCSSLTSVIISNSVTEIAHNAFSNCSSLTSVTLGNNVTKIGVRAFLNCSSLKNITIPDSIISIAQLAFSGCSSLISVTIGNGVTSIGEAAFKNCSHLTSVHISDLSAWCKISFDGYSENAAYTNPLSYGANLYLDGDLVTELTIPSDITEIKRLAFHGCSSLTSVTIPDGVTSIRAWAFNGCSSLTSITIPNSVAEIEYRAFYECNSLPIIDNLRYADTYAVEVIDKSLNAYTIKDGTRFIGSEAFYDCTSLTSITIPDSVTSIGNSAFYNCSGLKNITIPDSVADIVNYAFENCSSLTRVTIGNGVTSIGEAAFNGCSSLTEVYCKPTTPPTGGSSMFSGNASSRMIYVPTASVEAYKSASGWSTYKSYIVGHDF